MKHNDRGSILDNWLQTIDAYLTGHVISKKRDRSIMKKFRCGIIKNDVENGEENQF